MLADQVGTGLKLCRSILRTFGVCIFYNIFLAEYEEGYYYTQMTYKLCREYSNFLLLLKEESTSILLLPYHSILRVTPMDSKVVAVLV